MRKLISALWAVAFLAAASLSGCGGSDSGSGGSSTPAATISGTASSGAPFNGVVTLKDARGKTLQVATNPATGAFIFTVTDLKAPFILKAGTFYSIATAAGTTNINPFTNIVSRSAAGTGINLDTVFANVSSNRSSLTSTTNNLQTAIANFNNGMNQKDSGGKSVYTQYGLASPPDFMNGQIGIDVGVDKLFSLVTVDLTGSTVTVTTKAGAVLMSGSFSGTTFNFTPNFTNIGSITISTASCKAGYQGATATFVLPGVTCSSIGFCVSTSNPQLFYYLVKGTEIPLDYTKIMAYDSAYMTSLGTQIANACM